MSIEAAVEALEATFATALAVVLPLILTAMSVGLSVSLLQAATSLQEQTLAFVPKLIAVVVVMVVSASWMIEQLLVFTESIFNKVAGAGP